MLQFWDDLNAMASNSDQSAAHKLIAHCEEIENTRVGSRMELNVRQFNIKFFKIKPGEI